MSLGDKGARLLVWLENLAGDIVALVGGFVALLVFLIFTIGALFCVGLFYPTIETLLTNTVIVYPIEKLGDSASWIPLNRTEYRINVDNQTVVSNMPGMPFPPKTYRKCRVFNTRNWECTYSDGSGKFGMKDGDYYEIPIGKIKYVGWWRYWYHHWF